MSSSHLGWLAPWQNGEYFDQGAANPVVHFDDRADGALNGAYGGLDWGTAVWAVGGPWAGINTKNAFLSAGGTGTATGRINAGTGGAFLLKSLVTTGNSRWTITLRDNNGQTVTRTLSRNTPTTITTGWTLASTWSTQASGMK